MITGAELNQLVAELDLPQAGPFDRARITHSVLAEAAEDLDNRLADHDGRFTRLTVRALKSLSSSPDPAYVRDLIDDVKAAIFQAAKRDEDTDFLRVCLRALEVVKRGRLIEWQIFIQGVALCYAHAALDEGADNEQAAEVANDTAAALLERAVSPVANPGAVVKSRVVSLDRYTDRGGSGSVATVTVSGFSRPVFVVFYSQVAKGHRAAGPRVFTLSDRGKPKSVSERVAKIALHALSSAGRTKTRR